jgi:hypothetical protein
MTLKIYNSLEEVPEALRGEYKKSDGRYVPDLSDDHPVLVHNKTLLAEKSTATAKVKELEADIEASKSSTLQRGHVQVPKADATLLDEYKALGVPADVKVKLTEHETLKGDAEKRSKEDKLVLVAKELGYDNVEAFKRLPGLPDFDIRIGKDGKNSVFALVKDGDKTVEKPATEFLESSPDHAPFLSALKTQPTGVTVHTTPSTTTPKAGEPFAWAKEFAKNYSEGSTPVNDLAKSFAERSA